MKGLLAFYLALITLSACSKTPATKITHTVNEPDTTAKTDDITYLALGDSYTVGEAEPVNASFPAQLTSQLNLDKFSVKPPNIIAVTGWTTSNLIHAIAQSSLINKKYAIVTLLIGVNDQYQHVDTAVYHANFIQLLHTAINFAKGDSSRVFVLSIPDYGVTPFAAGRDSVIGPQIDLFNSINKKETLKAGAAYIDITPISRKAADDPSLIAPDGLHPSGTMYNMWVQLLYPLVEARLNK
jgi:lysophospholipase L1-like esterase